MAGSGPYVFACGYKIPLSLSKLKLTAKADSAIYVSWKDTRTGLKPGVQLHGFTNLLWVETFL